MRLVLSDRGSAALLLIAAAAALLIGLSPAGPVLVAVRGTPLPVGGLGLHLAVGDLVSDGLLAVFFLLVAVELRTELTTGDLASPRTAALPAIGALGGVVAPAAVYLLVAGREAPGGWPVPTATDIAFALGLLALLGRGLPNRVRAFLLGLAILDDLVAILLIAVVLPVDVRPGWLLPAAALLAGIALLARRGRPGPVRTAALWALGALVWCCVARSGVHPTIAGVAVGLVLPAGAGRAVERALQPVVRAVILPLFAFTAALLPLRGIDPAALGPVFWGTALALPLGKAVGIVGAGAIATRALRVPEAQRLRLPDLAVIGVVSGVGFTVSLLMAGLAFRADDTEAVLGVLTGSLAAALVSALVVPLVARSRRSG